MPMGNIVPRAGIKYTSLTFCATVLTITPHSLPDGNLSMQLLV